ncbi:ABC transporter substrate-binding protein, partial [Lutimonas sp.]|uniref:ABC transporter substrate-binding protein n=1 Tax=Lutimonas sp. TaxID=1872403 RepID=UPI003D9AFF1B
EQINSKGGINGRPLKLIVRIAAGSWGAGSREVVDLVFKDKVEVILGAIHGQDSHLAEQVIAKTQVVYLSSWASDATLSKAYVPWFFSLVPTDDQQAIMLLEDLLDLNYLKDIVVLHDGSYDAEQALKSLKSTSKEFIDCRISELSTMSLKSMGLLDSIEQLKPDVILVMGSTVPVSTIQQQLEGSKNEVPVYMHLSAQSTLDFSQQKRFISNHWRPLFSPDFLDSEFVDFQDSYKNACKRTPDALAVFVYDGIMMISKAMMTSQRQSLSLQKSMLEIKYQGLTGVIDFDSLGRRKSTGKPPIIRE